MSHKILIVDDEFSTASLYRVILEEYGFEQILTCEDSRDALAIIEREAIDLLLTDLLMPHINGKELLMAVGERFPQIPVIILTAQDRVDTAVECMKFGAFDFMTKPVEPSRLISAVQHAFTIRELKQEVSILSGERPQWELENPRVFDRIITRSPRMYRIFAHMEAIAGSSKPLLITGESGTGKGLIARALHELSGREGEFITLRLGGMDDDLLSEVLYGGSGFLSDGQSGNQGGLLARAGQGTLFLDEIGEMPLQSQLKLLRLLQEGEYFSAPGEELRTSQVRIIASSNADLRLRQEEGRFRRDLYYRLIAHHIDLPPLRDRPEDIPLLVDYFLQEALTALGRRKLSTPSEIAQMLRSYSFPGNIRELQGLMYDIASSPAGQGLDFELLKEHINAEGSTGGGVNSGDHDPDCGGRFIEGPGGMMLALDRLPAMRDVESFLYREALRRSGGNQSRAARILDISQSTLSRWKQTSEGN